MKTAKTYYRLVDSRGEPYATCYNETTKRGLAFGIYSLGQEFFDEEGYSQYEILKDLVKGRFDFGGYIIEKSKKPFPADEDPMERLR